VEWADAAILAKIITTLNVRGGETSVHGTHTLQLSIHTGCPVLSFLSRDHWYLQIDNSFTGTDILRT
jgi:hypothetical protein